MSILSTSIKFIRQAAVLALLPWLAWSCQWIDEYDDETDIGAAPNYINITISVSAENNAPTRAPLGGEYGDGVEKGLARENQVNSITLIFYQDNTGINTTSDDAEVLCVKQYAVRPFTENDLPNAHIHKTGETSSVQDNEVLYTTGDQKLEETTLQAGQNYKVLVVANASANVFVGDKIKDVRDKLTSSVYTGSGAGIDATDFVMTSESDATVSLTSPTIDTSTGENRFIYYFDCIHIERLAARIDYYTRGATTYDATLGGYKYTSSSDLYVVTKVTPFNLYNEDENLFKRVRSDWTDTGTTTWLGDETTSNYVVDPNTANKDNIQTFRYLSPIAATLSDDYGQAMNKTFSNEQLYKIGNDDNIIIAYPKENTLMPTSHLKKYATGIAFHVDYYVGGTGAPQHRVYYHYLRHQGEFTTGSYQARQWNELSDEESSSSHDPIVPMNYGIVRNNIYRVEISGFTDEGIDLKIKVKKWDKYEHATIYM